MLSASSATARSPIRSAKPAGKMTCSAATSSSRTRARGGSPPVTGAINRLGDAADAVAGGLVGEPQRARRQPQCGRHSRQVAADQRHIGRLDRMLRGGLDRRGTRQHDVSDFANRRRHRGHAHHACGQGYQEVALPLLRRHRVTPSTTSTPATVARNRHNTSIGGSYTTEVVGCSPSVMGATSTTDCTLSQLHADPAAAAQASTNSTTTRVPAVTAQNRRQARHTARPTRSARHATRGVCVPTPAQSGRRSA